MRTAIRSAAAVGKGGQALVGVADQPAVKGSAIDAVAGGDVGDTGAAVQHFTNRQVALLNHRKLHQHDLILLGSIERK